MHLMFAAGRHWQQVVSPALLLQGIGEGLGVSCGFCLDSWFVLPVPRIVKTKKARDAREKDSRPGHGPNRIYV